jgi:hypothetical protein
MSDERESLVRRYRRRNDERMETRMSELVGRTGFLDRTYASASRRSDQIEFRMERIQRRLDLIGEPTG